MQILLHKPEQSLIDYKVSLAEKTFTTADGQSYQQTAIVDFFDAKGRKKESKEYGVIPINLIYEKIEQGHPLSLNDCYIHNFSLAAFREKKSIPENQHIILKDFSAKNSFFDGDKTVDFSHSQFTGSKVSFEAAIFGNGVINFTHAHLGDASVNFKRTRFGEGIVDFRFAEFGNSNLSFRYANFGEGDVFFVNAKFAGKDTDFHSVTWGHGLTDFGFAKFTNGTVSFEKNFFDNGKTNFKAAEFSCERVDFKRVNWGDGDVSFEGCEFNDSKASFRSSIFGKGDINFEETDFGKHEVSFAGTDFFSHKVSFQKAKAQSLTFESCRLNAYFDFRFAKCELLDLRNTILRDIIDFIPEEDYMPVTILSFSGMKNMGRINIDWKKNHVKRLIYKQKGATLQEKAEQFRLLKEEFHTVGKYLDEDKAYVEYMRCEDRVQLQEDLNNQSAKKLLAYPSYIFRWLIFDKMGQYATNPLRVILSMGVVYTVFSCMYYVLPRIANAAIYSSYNFTDASSLAVAFYYSAITFLTVGFGDYYTTGLLRIVSAAEGFMGVFMMSYFTVAFVRKILR